MTKLEKLQRLSAIAQLPEVEYRLGRKDFAQELDMPLGDLDRAVADLRPHSKNGETTPPTWSPLTSTCAASVDGYELFQDVSAAIRQFVRLEESQAIVLALWVLFTWIFEQCAETNPFLRIVSPEPNCGKSTLLDVLERLARAVWLISSSTKSAFIRKLQTGRVTFALDEADAFLQEAEDFRNILDAASRSNGSVGLSIAQGDDWVSSDINVFVPIVIASIKKLRRMETVEQRSIHIWLKRATKAERQNLTKARRRTLKQILDPIADRCARWALDNAAELVGKDPSLDFEDGRDCDKWSPLVAIADYLDARLGERVRRIGAELIGETAGDSQSFAELLLGDIKHLFDQKLRNQNGADPNKYPSTALCDDLAGLEDRPWRVLPAGKGREPQKITPNRLARMLKDFQIVPHTVRFGGDTAKAYERADFVDAWLRYPLNDEPDQPEQNADANA